jgi:hypothetical protein
MGLCVGISVFLAGTTGASAGPMARAGARSSQVPPWLRASERETLRTVFGNAKPIAVAYIGYPKKIAVIWTFSHVVVCGICGGPSNTSIPRGRVVRVSFDRQSHRLAGAKDGWAMQFCEVRGNQPPKQNCLHR